MGNLQLLMDLDAGTISGAQCASVPNTDAYINNTCISTTRRVESIGGGSGHGGGSCPPTGQSASVSRGNTFIVPHGNATISCGGQALSLAEAAAKGVDVGATAKALEQLTTAEVVGLVRELLSF